MERKFQVGDHVSWNSEAGRVRGTIKKKVTSPITFKNYTVRASKEEPRYLIKSDKTDHLAMHKGTALKKIRKSNTILKKSKTAGAEIMENRRNCSEDMSAADTLIACEHETWSFIQRKDLKGFARYLAEDFYDIFPDGQERTKSELLEFLRGADLQDYRLSHFRVTMLTQEAAIVTYQADFHAVIQGREMSMKESVTSGWAKRDGRWLNVSAVGSARRPQHLK